MRSRTGLIFLFLLTCTVPALAQVDRQAVFPRFASGNGWTSEFYFANQGLVAFEIIADFYDQNGAPLSVTTNLGTGSSFTFTLNGGSTQAVRVDSTGAYKEGYVVANYPTYYSPIRGTVNYRYEQDGMVQVQVGIPQQEWAQHYSFPVIVDSSKHIYTAVAFSKPAAYSESDESIIVSLVKTDGSIQATKSVPMKAGQHLAGFIDQDWLFPGLDHFEGSVNVSSPSGISVLSLRQDKQAFGAISTDSGPMAGAFAVAAPVIDEIEPNNSELEAQTISGSTVIRGNIEDYYALDFFKFTGKKGDIVTITCDTTQVNSYLDSVIGLFDSDMFLIASNDQNGMEPDRYMLPDSFLQLELPKDGTYYILVEDYYFNGGENFQYNLHVKFQ